MQAEWRPIPEFPKYSVSSEGYVRNEENGNRMSMSVNQSGIVYVRLTKNCIQYARGMALLVADVYLKEKPNKNFDSAVNLDGDRFNNRAANLIWRPRWFATKYFQQLDEAYFDDPYPIEDTNTHEQFYNPWSAAKKYGLLQADILLSICNGTLVWPTKQTFKRIE